jgi:uncharacterized membrane protein YjgN (DUF898 family)
MRLSCPHYHQTMDPLTPQKRLSFTGKGADLFTVLIVNWLLTLITLGFYYPWAKARRLQYYYEHCEVDGHPFHFHGTGKEMFIGWIKAVLLLTLVYGVYIYGIIVAPRDEAGAMIALVGVLIALVGSVGLWPLIIHGSYRYRMSRSSWRGIHFGYRGKLKELFLICLRDGFITLITCGIYGSWLQINVRNYVLSNVRYGSSKFRYKADGGDYFLINFKGLLLTYLTVGIYSFWWMRDRFRFYVDNLSWQIGEGPDARIMRFKSTATGGGFFGLMIVNALIVIFTLGIGYAWAEVRTFKYVLANIDMLGDADLNAVVQTEQENKNAMADDLGDMMDIGIFV